MTALVAVAALLLAAPSVRASVDRAYLPAGAGDTAPVVHLAVRGAKEVEVSLYEVAHPTQTLLGLPPVATTLAPPPPTTLEPPPLTAALTSLRRRAREGYTTLWRSLREPAREAVKDVLGLERPVGASWLAAPSAPESRVRSGEKLLRSWRLPTGEAGWNYTDLEVGLLPSGLYRLEALAGAADTEILLTVSRLSLLASRTSEGSSILATDSVDGRALAGVELFARGATLGKTGPGGLWSTRAPLEGPLVGRFEGQLARVALRPGAAAFGLRPSGEAGPPPPARGEGTERATAALFFDRRSYKPGEEVHLWALLRNREGGAWKIPEADEASIQLVDRQGTVLVDEPAEVSALGVVSKDLELPSGLWAGWYALAVAWSGERRAGEILVQSQAPAEIVARWQVPEWSPPSQPLDVALLVTDRLGRPEPGVAVHWSAEARGSGAAIGVSLGPSEVSGEGAGVTREDGRLPLRLPPAHGEGVLALHAEAEDSAGRNTSVDAEVRRIQAPALLEVSPERRVLRPGHPSSVALEARTLEGQPWPGRVEVHILGVHSSPGGEAVRSELLAKVVDLDAHGRGSVTVPAAPAGYLEVRATVPDGSEPPSKAPALGQPAAVGEAGLLQRASIFVTENGGDIPTTPDRLELVLDRLDYAHGDEVRLLILTPFESGTVLVGVEPSGGPADELVAIHGYSGVAHLRLPASAAAARLTAAALVGGTLYRDSVLVPLPERAPLLAIHLGTDRPLHAGQRTVLAVGATDPEGRGVPAALEISASTSPPAAPSLGQLFFPAAPAPAAWLSSSGADDSAFGVAGGVARPRSLQPFGPSQLGDVAWEREVASSQTSRLAADDLGHAAWVVHVPADAERLYVTVRGVGGPDLFGERSWILPIAPAPRLNLEAPRWVRAGDRFEVRATAREAGAVGCALTLEATGGELAPSVCSDAAGRGGSVTAGTRDVELASALPAQKLVAHRTVRVEAAAGATPTTAGELARGLAEGLAGSAQSADPVELDCAAVRALGALGAAEPDARAVAAAVARIALEQNAAGGFGSPDGELRRDVAALRGLAALKEAGTSVDAGLLSLLQRRVEALVEGVADVDERERLQGLLPREGPGAARRPGRLPSGEAADVAEGDPAQIADWLAGHRPNPAGAAILASRLAALVAEAGPLEAAEIAAALAALDPRQAVELVAGAPAVARRYLRIERQPWTDAMLAADEEPAEPSLQAVEGPIPLGAELEVALEAPVDASARFACLRDFLPAGLAPLGAPEVSQGGLLLCGPTKRDRLEVSYQARAVRAGRFQAPGAGLGAVAPPGPATWVEVAP